MKFRLISALTVFSVLGLCQQAKAYNLEACAKDPMTSAPQVINLLQPIDQKMIDCIPNLDSIASQWQSKANSIRSSINQVNIGNQGKTGIEKLEYNVAGGIISLVATVQAKHTWNVTIPEVRERVPVDKYRWADIPYPDVRMERKCRLGVCVKVPVPFTNYRREKVPYVEMEMRTITPKRTVSQTASATCKYDYTLNLSTFEQKPIFNCGQGWSGNIKLDASAITSILNGEMPTLGKLVNSLSVTPPLFKDANRDTYNDERNKMIANHSSSFVYFSSQSFVEWASAENHGTNIVLAAVSGGGYGAELVRQIQQRLTTELGFLGTWASQTAVNLGVEQIVSMLTTGEVMNFGRFRVSVKAVNVPYVYQKCVVNRGDCTPEAKSPRLGFAIIATPSN
ncbi:hypothetical protein [Microcoleus vaginatus]|uniref:hypothetical protein n=1 Tax=Microcoleus vaginatus TaxID=119532 RepID=UPI0016891455|nr:hypothetical protein [Microcoleus sp. FACHB-84]MBD2011220.1 hypothetical protein [Microcoleus sp. FACHB-45]